uniref:Kinesin-like protein n=1 Tax=Kalanchoe fedtschenkoi TaxID=63787 RepID=A0A7N0TCF7_KALFE
MTSRSGGTQRGSRSSAARARSAHSLSATPTLRRSAAGSLPLSKDDAGVPGRVRVAVRLRPRNQEELVEDADFADCVELQPELKRLRLRKNNWDFDTYEFDEVLTEFASQRRVYEVVAKPVVESVLEGYNGTVMAYGQTGTGKTHTLGRLGEEDTSARGIMVRSMEDILASISPQTDSLSVSYLQLYMETIQDLLDPANDNIAIVEDPKTGDVSVPGATSVDIRDEHSFMELLRIGEAHRIAANTKLNTESSRSHAILMVHIRKSVVQTGAETSSSSQLGKSFKPLVRKGKLVVVDLAGSERMHKSGSEGHVLEETKSINLSLSALGKCINALAENSTHVPVRDSKLTRLLKDSFGGTARTSLVVTIGPSPRHRGETASTILFGQRAMKVENMLKIKEEFDYRGLSRKLEMQLDAVIAENERRQKSCNDELERISIEAQNRITEAERNYSHAFEMNGSEEAMELKRLLQNETRLRHETEDEANRLRSQLEQFMQSEDGGALEICNLRRMLEDEIDQKRKLEEEIAMLRSQLLQLTFNSDQMRRGSNGDGFSGLDSLMSQFRNSQINETGNGQKAPMTSLFEQVGLQKILSLLESEDASVRIHAVKVVANLAAEESNQQRIVEAGGLTSLLMLLRNFEDETIRRVAAGAIANLAMNEYNQELIMSEGGIGLLSMTAADADDAQTLRMVAGAIANLCGNDKLQKRLRSEGGIKALLGMVRCGHSEVLSQIARGIANFAKCESRASTQGRKTGRSFLIEDGALPWIVQNANNEVAPIRRHIELALCHLAQHEVNAKDMINGGALWELVRISRDCSREDIRSLAHRTLSGSPTFRSEMRRLRIDL